MQKGTKTKVCRVRLAATEGLPDFADKLNKSRDWITNASSTLVINTLITEEILYEQNVFALIHSFNNLIIF